jgi:methionyl-tRNA synthetase
MITFDEFSKLDLRVGEVLDIQNHPNADKLYVLQVGLGEKTIQLVAGLRGHYQIEQLKGKQIVVLTNLEPRSLRGIESQGMLLAAQSQEGVSILSPDKKVEPGSTIK